MNIVIRQDSRIRVPSKKLDWLHRTAYVPYIPNNSVRPNLYQASTFNYNRLPSRDELRARANEELMAERYNQRPLVRFSSRGQSLR
jgi:hypothetical protein